MSLDPESVQLLSDLTSQGFTTPHVCRRCEVVLKVPRDGSEVWNGAPSHDLPISDIREFAAECPLWRSVNDMIVYLEYYGNKADPDTPAVPDDGEPAPQQRPRGWEGETGGGLKPGPGMARVETGFWKHSVGNDWVKQAVKLRINLTIVVYRSSAHGRTAVQHHMNFLALKFPNQSLAKDPNLGTYSINPHPGSEMAFKLARKWLANCEKNHNCGLDALPSSLPKRLVRIEKDPETSSLTIFMVETSTRQMTPYVALSYCWGPQPQKVLLTGANYSQVQAGLQVADMQPAIRDAVETAHRLGFAYIWIDALCILQDAGEDKAGEINRMSEIYSNATLTIIASRSTSVEEGFLHPRALLGSRMPERVFLATCVPPEGKEEEEDGEPESVVLVPEFSEKVESWDSRAWTLQERLFSRRVIKYGAHQTSWICHGQEGSPVRSTSDGWSGVDGVVEGNVWKDGNGSTELEGLMIDMCGMVREVHKLPEETMRKEWQQLIRAYSRRKLSVQLDRLPAMSSIAQRFASAFKDDYLAGHWKSDLAIDLMWARFGMFQPAPVNRPRPTWSWGGYSGDIATGIWNSPVPDDNFAVLDAQTELLFAAAPFGAVKSGRLRLIGFLAPVDVKLLAELEYSGKYTKSKLEDMLENSRPPKTPSPEYLPRGSLGVGWDYSGDVDDYQFRKVPHPAFLFVLIRGAGGPGGLILLRGETGTFTRLGVFNYEDSSLKKKWGEDDDAFRTRYQAGLERFWGNNIEEVVIE